MKRMLNGQTDGPIIAVLGAVLYTGLMGLGMLMMNKLFGYNYSQPEMVFVIAYVEIVLTLFVIVLIGMFFKWRDIGFNQFEKGAFVWLIPHLLVISGMTVVFFSDLIGMWTIIDSKQQILMLYVGFTTLLVGISEEMMYRGIVLHSFTHEKRRVKGVLISSLCFSLLHSVNVLGGFSIENVGMQLITTFIFGFCFANLALKVKHLFPLILFHWLWDFVIIGSEIIGSSASQIIIYVLPINILMGVAAWVSLKSEGADK